MTNRAPLVGVYGKLPAHGDFIHRNLPSDFINHWDEWMQHFIAGSREQMSDSWLDIYLTSPIWRFVFSPGVIDANSWAGIMMPSVDRVGRYFPLSIVSRVDAVLNPLDVLTRQKDWFVKIEDLALQALESETSVDDLMQDIHELKLDLAADYAKSFNNQDSSSRVAELNTADDNLLTAYSCLLDSLLSDSHASYSAWTTTGSERVRPCLFTTQGLPPLHGLSAMLDGQWIQWNWKQPYILQTNT